MLWSISKERKCGIRLRDTKFLWWKDREEFADGRDILFSTTDIDEARNKRAELNNLNNKIYIRALEE